MLAATDREGPRGKELEPGHRRPCGEPRTPDDGAARRGGRGGAGGVSGCRLAGMARGAAGGAAEPDVLRSAAREIGWVVGDRVGRQDPRVLVALPAREAD